MVLPKTVHLAAVPGSNRTDRVGHELGIGYARLAVQLTACWMGLESVWLLDDNVQDCYRLQYQEMLRDQTWPAPLHRVSFGEIMQTVQQQVRTPNSDFAHLA